MFGVKGKVWGVVGGDRLCRLKVRIYMEIYGSYGCCKDVVWKVCIKV